MTHYNISRQAAERDEKRVIERGAFLRYTCYHDEHCVIFAPYIFIQCSFLDGMLLAARTRIIVIPVVWRGNLPMTQLPSGQHITYQLQYRKCGKPSCSTCRDGQGHGPYWYAYWREGARLRSGYVGKTPPDEMSSAVDVSTPSSNNGKAPATGLDESQRASA